MDKQTKVITLIAEILQAEPLQLSATTAFIDIPNWDSLAHLQIIAEFEDAFSVKIPMEKMAEIKTIKDLLDYMD